MTNEEKEARGICDKFLQINNNHDKAKQCALICVEEIIETYHSPMDDEQIKEWQTIKQIIEQL